MTPEQAKAEREREIVQNLPDWCATHSEAINKQLIERGCALIDFLSYLSEPQKGSLIKALKEYYEPQGWIVWWRKHEYGDRIELKNAEQVSRKRDTAFVLAVAGCIVFVLGLLAICLG